jgi:plastocyanin
MGARPGEKRFARKIAGLAFAAASASFLLYAPAAPAADPTIEAAGGVYSFSWSPSSAEVAPGGSVVFKSPSPSVPHGVTWSSGPETPGCSGVPIDDGKTGWSGSRSFAQAGAYPFVCSVHPEMTGKVTVGAPGSAPVTPPPPGYPGAPGAPDVGPAMKSLTLAKIQRGALVKGSLEISENGAGSRLRVDLFARRSALFDDGVGKVRVGGIRRPSLGPGLTSFRVRLKGGARRALLVDDRLSLQVMILIVTPGGERVLRTRGITLYA